MRIASSTIQFASQRVALAQRTVRESLRAWVGPQRPDFEGRERAATPAALADAARQQVAQMAQAAQAAAKARPASAEVQRPGQAEAGPGLDEDPKMLLIKTIIEKLLGKKIHVISAKDLEACRRAAEAPTPASEAAGEAAPAHPARAGFGIEYDRQETYTEAETTTMAAAGVINTADGKQVSFTLSLNMSRSFTAEASFSLRAGDAVRKDPLVINFGGNAVQLTDTKFAFDIDADGQADQVSFLRPGSGFLALDANGDGAVNSGSELFGARSGDGFAELTGYDTDGNGWIDEADRVYAQLRVWVKDGQGKDSLTALPQAGVGAIYLGKATTPFDLKDEQNQMQGQVRTSGVYLREDGTAGTVQQVDLAV